MLWYTGILGLLNSTDHLAIEDGSEVGQGAVTADVLWKLENAFPGAGRHQVQRLSGTDS